MKKIKYYFYQFDLNNQISIRIKSESYDEAIRVFKVTFGEFLFTQVKSIFNINYHG